jgi:hypothetical protein
MVSQGFQGQLSQSSAKLASIAGSYTGRYVTNVFFTQWLRI